VRKLALPLVLVMARGLAADEIHLVGGGVISGEIVERTDTRIVIETGPGRVTLPMSRVARVQEGRSILADWKDRLRAVRPDDAEAYVALARWASDRNLETQAREAYERALAADPAHAAANAALGRQNVDGRWMSAEDAHRARGLVPYEGRWVTPAEREASERARFESSLAEQSQREAEARVREAEARARAAEAEARRLESEAEATSGDGLPWWPYVYGGGGVLLPSDPACCTPPDRPHPPRRPRPEPRATPAPTPPPPSPPPATPPKPPGALPVKKEKR
jgi:hypothetical protein